MREFQASTTDEMIVALDMACELPERTICLLQRRGVRPTVAARDLLDVVRAVADAGGRPVQAAQ